MKKLIYWKIYKLWPLKGKKKVLYAAFKDRILCTFLCCVLLIQTVFEFGWIFKQDELCFLGALPCTSWLTWCTCVLHEMWVRVSKWSENQNHTSIRLNLGHFYMLYSIFILWDTFSSCLKYNWKKDMPNFQQVMPKKRRKRPHWTTFVMSWKEIKLQHQSAW